MIKVDLITGFLGSGKTTFLKTYAKHFMDKGQKVGILENDYGAVNVDMLMLNELRGEKCELEMVAGACDADCHKRRFKTKLISMGMCGYNRVIIEPSGIFDVDEFFDSLREEPLDRWYEIGNVIAIVDARLEDEMSEESDFYLASQVANAGTILLSRSQLVNEEKINNTIEHIKTAVEKTKMDRKLDDIINVKDWKDFDESDLEKISNCGYRIASYQKNIAGNKSEYSTVYFLELPITEEKLLKKTKEIMANESYGNVVRLKGFFKEEGKWKQVNATKNEFDITEIPVGQEVFIIIGENLNEEKIKKYFAE